MEDTLREEAACRYSNYIEVLILVLMEDTLRARDNRRLETNTKVLILVLMEDTLRVREQNLRILEFRGFDNSKTYKIGFC